MSWLQTLQHLRRSRRLAPEDGMSLTVDAWNAAHDYHRQLLQAALLAARGWGIIDGLNLTLDNNDQRRIHVSPGIAIDPTGRLLVFAGDSVQIQQQLNTSRLLDVGVVRITLQATEAQVANQPHYVNESCRLLVEMANAPASESTLELARVDLSAIDAQLHWPTNPDRPARDELDCRFRLHIGAKTPITLALVKLDDTVADDHLLGWRALSREVAYTTARPILLDEWSEQTLPSLEKLRTYQLICLVGRDTFIQDQSKSRGLEEYVKGGGLLFYESCRQNQGRATLRLFGGANDQAFLDWCQKLQTASPLETISSADLFTSNHPIARTPYLFRQPPRGYEDPGTRDFRVIRGLGKGLILYSNLDYGCAFAGKLNNNSQPTRNEVREILEWGHNLLTLAGNYSS